MYIENWDKWMEENHIKLKPQEEEKKNDGKKSDSQGDKRSD